MIPSSKPSRLNLRGIALGLGVGVALGVPLGPAIGIPVGLGMAFVFSLSRARKC